MTPLRAGKVYFDPNCPLTNRFFPGILPDSNAMTGTSSAAFPAQRAPGLVKRGEEGGVNTSLSSGPNPVVRKHDGK